MRQLPRWIFVVLILAGAAQVAVAQDAADGAQADDEPTLAMPPPAHLDRVPIRELDIETLDGVVNLIAATVGQEMVRLRVARAARDCTELTRIANSLALGHEMLGEADTVLSEQDDQEAFVLRAKVVQARVLAFSGRYRTLAQLRGCGRVEIDAETRDAARYATPAPLATAEYTQAAIDLLEAGEANLAAAVASGVSRECRPMALSKQSISLFLPYLDEVMNLLKDRPQAMGPRANRSQLAQLRARLVEGDRLLGVQIARSCSADRDSESGDDAATPGKDPEAPKAKENDGARGAPS